MEGPPSSPSSSSPSSPSPSPYRADKPLDQIIPPDRRREKTIAVVIVSMLAGIGLWQLGGAITTWMHDRAPPTPPPPAFITGRITPSVLAGPGGAQHVPLGEMHVVHVWLQGCQDCMPAFEAMRELHDRGGLGVSVPELNVAYGEADLTWANRYGVGHNLLWDANGAAFVKPLGIGTFTTLVVDASGNVIHRDRPDRPGYRDRVRAAVGEVAPEPNPNDPLARREPPSPFGREAIQGVIGAHTAGLKRTCWDLANGSLKTSASVKMVVSIGTDGSVVNVTGSGTDPRVVSCVSDQIRTWRFPPPENTTTVSIPFNFVRE